jgi:O-antigen/teichoic acid export membrane protein
LKNNWIREGFIYGISGVLSRFTGIFLIPIYTRYLTTAEYGLLDLSTSIFAILYIIFETQMISGYTRSYFESKDKDNRNSLAGTVLIYYMLSNIVLWILALSTQRLLAQYLPEFQIELLLPILVRILPTQVVQLALMLLRLEHQPRAYLIISVGQIWLSIILGITAVTYLDAGVVGILWSLAISQFIFVIPSLIVIYRTTGISLNLSYIREVFSYSAPIVPANLGSWIRSYASRLFIVSALSLSILGVYSIATKVAAIFLLFSLAFRLTWTPYSVEQFTIPDSENKFSKALNLYLYASFLVLVLIAASSPLFVRILATESYWGAIPFVTILSSAHLWDGAVYILAAGNSWERKTYFNTLGSLAGGIVTIGLLFWGIDRYGLQIVALAFWMGTVVKALLIYWTAQNNHFIPYSRRAISIALIATFSFSLLCYGIAIYSAMNFISLMAAIFIFGCIFLAIMWISLLSFEERKIVTSTIRDILKHNYLVQVTKMRSG